MSVERQFTPAGLSYARRDVPLAPADIPIDLLGANALVPVDEPAEWELYAEDKTGAQRHVWRHKASGWCCQYLAVPVWILRDPKGARKWLMERAV